MDKDANEIRHDIEDIRSRLGDRAKEAVADGVDALKKVVSAGRVETLIKENPVGVAVGSIAVGFLMGLLLPKTSIESEHINDAKRKAVDAGKQMVRETVAYTLKGVRS